VPSNRGLEVEIDARSAGMELVLAAI